MRVKLPQKQREKLFNTAYKQIGSWQNIANCQNISVRTCNDWRRGKISIPLGVFESLISISGLQKNGFSPKLYADFWHTKEAGRQGGLVYKELYGNCGTPEGRKQGGLSSIKTHNTINSNFRTRKIIKKPRYSNKLAEFMGIIIGDGHLSKYQITITTNLKTDYKHAIFVKNLAENLFGTSANLRNRKDINTVNVVVSSKNLVIFLNKYGMPMGNKIQNQLRIPRWIFKKVSYQKAFIRGLFDTDGCIYLDIHKRKNKKYKYLGWTITSYADKLILDIIKTLKALGFSPTHRFSQKSVYLRKQKEIIRYFLEIGTQNQKHYQRYKKFIGGVPKWS